MRPNIIKQKVLALVLTIVALAVGHTTAMAETVTYTITGDTDGQGNVELVVTASGSATGSANTSWKFSEATSASVSLTGGITLSFGSDKTSSLSVKDWLAISADGNTGGYITLSHASKYIYHITLKNDKEIIILDAWNMATSYTYRFKETGIKYIEVEYATAIPFTDAVISGINSEYIVSNAPIAPNPILTWHGTTLTKDTHYTLNYLNNTSAGTATVRATGKGRFSSSTSVSKNYTLVWATYSVRFNKNNDNATGTMSDQSFYYTEEKALTANGFTRTGYTFTGWNTAANGSGDSFTDGQSVSNLTTTNDALVDLYAQWTPNTYAVTLDNQNATTAGSTSVTATFDAAMPAITVPERTGYTFGGYYTEANGGGTKYYNADGTSAKSWDITSATTLYAQWTAITVAYIDGNGHEQSITYPAFNIIQNGSSQTLGTNANVEAWYVVIGNVTAGSTLTFQDQAAHLILCDDGTLNASSIKNGISCNGSLTIYGQSGGTGSIVAWNTVGSSDGINVKGDLTINGGTVNATGQYRGIDVSTGSVTINGGTVNVTGDSNHGIYAYNITLGWTNASDRITVNSYEYSPVVKTGQTFTDGTNIYTGTLTTSQRNAIAGKTLYPCLSLTLPEHFTASGTGVILQGSSYYVIPGTTVTLAYSGEVPEGIEWSYTYNDGSDHAITGSTFTMPAADVTVRATAQASSGISTYYIDADGRHDVTATVLTSKETSLSAGWYIAVGPLDYNHNIGLTGEEVNLILANDCQMNVGTKDSRISDTGIGTLHDYKKLNIYAQSTGSNMGTLSIYTGDGSCGICVKDLTINGGTIETTGGAYGIFSSTYFIVNGGTVNAVGKNGILAQKDVIINGGTVNATTNFTGEGAAGIYSMNENITLGWTNASDCITASSYMLRIGGKTVSVASGQRLTDGTNIYTGTLTSEQISAIAGKTLHPCLSLTLTEHVTASGTDIIRQGSRCYAIPGTTVTLAYSGEVPEGTEWNYTYNDGSDHNITGNTFTMPAADITVSTTLNSTDYITHWQASPDRDGSTAEKAYIITTPAGMNLLACEVNSGKNFSDTYFKLGGDIDMSGVPAFDPIGRYDSKPFCGHFDGQSHTISGLTVNIDANNNIGLFGRVEGSVSHLTLSGASITGSSCVGGIAASLFNTGSSLTDCHVVSTVITDISQSNNFYVGAIVGITTSSAIVSGCTYHSTIVRATNSISGHFHTDGDAFNIGTGQYWKPDGDYYYSAYGDSDGACLDKTKLFLADGADNSTLIAAYASPDDHTAYNTNGDNTPNFNAGIDVTLQGRKLWKDGDWNTLCLPFTMTAAQVTAQLTPAALKTLSSTELNGNTLKLNFTDATEIVAGKPYIIKWANTSSVITDPVFTGVTVSSATANVTTTYVDFIGTYNPINFTSEDKSILFLGAENKLYWPQSGASIGACRGYFQLKGITAGDPNNPASGLNVVMDFGDETTDITTTNYTNFTFATPHSQRENSDEWYDLQGRKLDKLPTKKGIYINNGRKVVIK